LSTAPPARPPTRRRPRGAARTGPVLFKYQGAAAMYCGMCGLISLPSSSTAAGARPALRASSSSAALRYSSRLLRARASERCSRRVATQESKARSAARRRAALEARSVHAPFERHLAGHGCGLSRQATRARKCSLSRRSPEPGGRPDGRRAQPACSAVRYVRSAASVYVITASGQPVVG